MQTTSALYQQILADPGHYFKTKVEIAGNEVDESQIIELEREAIGVADKKPSVGGALASQITLTILEPAFTIPRMAAVSIFVQACTEAQSSEWIPEGTYYIDTRQHNQTVNGVGTLKITAYDAMLIADQDYPSTNHVWPYRDALVVAEIASTMGVTVDPRTNQFLTAGYMVDMPVSYNMRETLANIAAAYGGNFVISPGGQLLFVPLYGLDPEITGNYLADENGNALVFGDEGWCILV